MSAKTKKALLLMKNSRSNKTVLGSNSSMNAEEGDMENSEAKDFKQVSIVTEEAKSITVQATCPLNTEVVCATIRREFENMRKALTCSICLCTYRDAVILSTCIHAYCRECLTTSLSSCKKKSCPQCQVPCTRRSITEAPNLNVQVKAYKLAVRRFGLAPRKYTPTIQTVTQLAESDDEIDSDDEDTSISDNDENDISCTKNKSRRRRRTSDLVAAQQEFLASKTFARSLRKQQERNKSSTDGKDLFLLIEQEQIVAANQKCLVRTAVLKQQNNHVDDPSFSQLAAAIQEQEVANKNFTQDDDDDGASKTEVFLSARENMLSQPQAPCSLKEIEEDQVDEKQPPDPFDIPGTLSPIAHCQSQQSIEFSESKSRKKNRSSLTNAAVKLLRRGRNSTGSMLTAPPKDKSMALDENMSQIDLQHLDKENSIVNSVSLPIVDRVLLPVSFIETPVDEMGEIGPQHIEKENSIVNSVSSPIVDDVQLPASAIGALVDTMEEIEVDVDDTAKPEKDARLSTQKTAYTSLTRKAARISLGKNSAKVVSLAPELTMANVETEVSEAHSIDVECVNVRSSVDPKANRENDDEHENEKPSMKTRKRQAKRSFEEKEIDVSPEMKQIDTSKATVIEFTSPRTSMSDRMRRLTDAFSGGRSTELNRNSTAGTAKRSENDPEVKHHLDHHTKTSPDSYVLLQEAKDRISLNRSSPFKYDASSPSTTTLLEKAKHRVQSITEYGLCDGEELEGDDSELDELLVAGINSTRKRNHGDQSFGCKSVEFSVDNKTCTVEAEAVDEADKSSSRTSLELADVRGMSNVTMGRKKLKSNDKTLENNKRKPASTYTTSSCNQASKLIRAGKDAISKRKSIDCKNKNEIDLQVTKPSTSDQTVTKESALEKSDDEVALYDKATQSKHESDILPVTCLDMNAATTDMENEGKPQLIDVATSIDVDSVADVATSIDVGSIVSVQSRTWPGVNQPGGVAKVEAIHIAESDGSLSYDVRYVIDRRREKNVDAVFVKLHLEFETELNDSDRRVSEGSSHSRVSRRISPKSSAMNINAEIGFSFSPGLKAALIKQGCDVEGAATKIALEKLVIQPDAKTDPKQPRLYKTTGPGLMLIDKQKNSNIPMKGQKTKKTELQAQLKEEEEYEKARKEVWHKKGTKKRKSDESKASLILNNVKPKDPTKRGVSVKNEFIQRAKKLKVDSTKTKVKAVTTDEAMKANSTKSKVKPVGVEVEVPFVKRLDIKAKAVMNGTIQGAHVLSLLSDKDLCEQADCMYHRNLGKGVAKGSITIVTSCLSELDEASLRDLCKKSKDSSGKFFEVDYCFCL